MWMSPPRCSDALLSQHRSSTVLHVQTSFAAVRAGHVCKSCLWPLVPNQEMRSTPLVTIMESLVSAAAEWSNCSPFERSSVAEAQMQSSSWQCFSNGLSLKLSLIFLELHPSPCSISPTGEAVMLTMNSLLETH